MDNVRQNGLNMNRRMRAEKPGSPFRRRGGGGAASLVRKDNSNTNTNRLGLYSDVSAPSKGFADVVETGIGSRENSRTKVGSPRKPYRFSKPPTPPTQRSEHDEEEDQAQIDPQFRVLEEAAQKLSKLLIRSSKSIPVPSGSLPNKNGERVWDDSDSSQLERQLLRSLEAAEEELWKRPKTGEIYLAVAADVKHIYNRLEDVSVSEEEATIDVGIEIADAANVLKMMSVSTPEIDMAAQNARRGALMLLQASIMADKGRQLLAETKRILHLHLHPDNHS